MLLSGLIEVYDDELSGWDDVPPTWQESRLMAFAEYFGYTIEEAPETVSGYRVTSPDGSRLSGYIANSIIKAWQMHPEGVSKSKSKGAKSAKSPEQKAAEKAAADAAKKADAQTAAHASLDKVLPDVLEAKSKGKIDAGAVQALKDNCLKTIESAGSAKAVRQALADFQKQLNILKQESTKPPPADRQLADTKTKLLGQLPDATVVAGSKFDQNRMQGVIDEGRQSIANAETPAAAAQALRDLRTAVAKEKVAQQREQAAAKTGLKRTAEEWARHYTELYFHESDAGMHVDSMDIVGDYNPAKHNPQLPRPDPGDLAKPRKARLRRPPRPKTQDTPQDGAPMP